MNSNYDNIVSWNERHKKIIYANEPECITKIGATESVSISEYLQTQGQSYKYLYGLNMSCGIYSSSHESHNLWCESYIKGIVASDYLHLWNEESFKKNIELGNRKQRLDNNWTDTYIYNTLSPYMKLKHVPEQANESVMRPFILGDDAWHLKLANTKILVVSSSQKSYEYQANRYHKLWNGSTLGSFEFVKIPSSEYLTEDSQNNQLEWSTKVDNAKNEILKKDFDFAMLGCGGIGLILVDFIKNELHKPCTYLGGCLQLFFGIRGNRWEHCEGWYNSNDYWIKPFPEDIPKNYMVHENGSYWV